ncbi:endoribonuclease MazF [Citrobacter portucalensis]|uniref:endoribonuclease MazF n=1 Tax=Citrobacter portucalensis TaxID=1639133 RepID=UPI00226B82D4|nr:endoribonuclease MazF [Citrobacter portucalensis]MCX9038807.1 endoribonuclease MazF [Citrobacter portucalensis]
MVKRYIPAAGDLIWLDFDPQAGHEQAGHRPAVILSSATYNVTGMLICVPVTTKVKGYPFEVELFGDVRSVALADQISSMDWKARNAQFIRKIDFDELAQIRELAQLLITSD